MMASFFSSQALIYSSCSSCSSSSSCNNSNLFSSNLKQWKLPILMRVRVRASNSQEAQEEEEDCNEEECAPDKEVGKVSMEWLAGDKTRVTGTFPPKKRGWTGYVEKDTAGQTNIYPVEPAVYIAESAISSGSAGSSSEGAENTAAVAAGIALISIAVASFILLQVGRKTSPPEIQQTLDQQYSGPSLSYYISKFKPPTTTTTTTQILQPPPEPQMLTTSAPSPSDQGPQVQLIQDDDDDGSTSTLPP